MKKGDLDLQAVGLILLAVAVLVVLLFLFMGGRDKLLLLFEKLKELFTFR